jgi:hypothetical protein
MNVPLQQESTQEGFSDACGYMWLFVLGCLRDAACLMPMTPSVKQL